MTRKRPPAGWGAVPVGQIIALEYGKSLPEKRRRPGPYAVYGSNGEVGRASEYLLEEATIVVGRKGSAGEINYAEPKSWPIDTTYHVQLRNRLVYSLDFVYYLLKWFDLRRLVDTTVKPGLNRDRVYEQVVPLPPLPVQARITQILQKADGVVQKRRQASLLSDAILPSVFNDMFANGDVTSNDHPRTTIGSVATLVTSGYTPRGGARNYLAAGPLLIRSQNVRMLNLDLTDCACLPEDIHQEMSRVRVMPGDVLLNITGASIGRVAWAGDDIPPANVNQHVCIIRPDRSKVLPEYLAYTLATPQYQHIILNAPGSAQTGFNHARVRALEIVLPPIPVQRSFVMRVESLREVHEKHAVAYRDVKAAFHALLEQAFAGALTAEWEVSQAQRIAEESQFLERLPQRLLLALLSERTKRAGRGTGEVLVTALMKYAFLLQMEGNGRRRIYSFVPYHYGPFAKELYADLQRLQGEGLIRVDNESDEDKVKITLTDPAKAEQALAELPADLRDDATAIIETYGDLDHNALLKTVYDKYPAYAKKSRLVKRAKKSGDARPAK